MGNDRETGVGGGGGLVVGGVGGLKLKAIKTP